jgi:phosphinothricin acetyltransferase
MQLTIENMKTSEWEKVARIYRAGIETKVATFQNEVPSWEEWDASHHKDCRLVAKVGDTVVGWVALSPTSKRKVYAGVAEASLYVDEAYKGQGIGTALLKKAIELSEARGFWTLQAGVIAENTRSIALLKKVGFREVGIREKVGRMDNGRWHDVVLMERRSKRI